MVGNTVMVNIRFRSDICKLHTCSFEIVSFMFVVATNIITCFAVVRGVGCIFTEMVSGTATFPGTKDAWDQLDRIWQVNGLHLAR